MGLCKAVVLPITSAQCGCPHVWKVCLGQESHGSKPGPFTFHRSGEDWAACWDSLLGIGSTSNEKLVGRISTPPAQNYTGTQHAQKLWRENREQAWVQGRYLKRLNLSTDCQHAARLELTSMATNNSSWKSLGSCCKLQGPCFFYIILDISNKTFFWSATCILPQ